MCGEEVERCRLVWTRADCQELCRLYDDNVALYGRRYYYYIWELPIFTLMGILAGLLGALFVRIHVICSRLRAKYVPATSPKRRLAEVYTGSTAHKRWTAASIAM